ncbi:MAG: MMPL family transporter [Eubacteriales bacterium]|nr:MMPL family transporter [Eubacteriales bacterium]
MDAYTNFILKHRKLIIGVFAAAMIVCAILSTFVGVNYNIVDYLPDDAASTKSLDVMEEEYDQAIPNARVLIYDVSIAEALSYKEQMEAVDGVDEVNWLDDAENIYEPLESMDQDTVDEWYKDGDALYSLTIDEDKEEQAIADLREIIGDENCMSGSAVTNALSPVTTAQEVQQIMSFVIPIVLIVLLLTTDSWFEPILFLLTIGVAIVLNSGTNLIMGTISFVTNAAGSVLQLAVSMDYSIFLLHRFSANRQEGMDVEDAMVAAVRQSVGSVLSSGLTTVTGFASLILMRFKLGPDLGWAMAKAIVCSLICVLCLLPALAISTYKLIDKTSHRSLVPKFDKFAKAVMKMRIPAMAIFLILVIPCYLAQGKNDFFYGASNMYSTNATQLGRDLNAIDEEYGASNPVVVMVPKGDLEKESALNEELKSLDYVTSVISYVNTVGASIPEDYIPEESLSQLYSEHYSRFVVSLDTEEKEAGWYEKIDEVRDIARKYYGDEVEYAGDLVSTEDLKSTIITDNERVNLLAIGFVFLILVLNFKSITIPIILTLVIEASIWINLSVPYLQSSTVFYIAYLIINTVQLGATIDYAILFTDRYMEFRKEMPKKEAAYETVRNCTISIFTSAIILTLAGTVLGIISSNGILSQLGILIGRGATISFIMVIFVLPALLILFDGIIEKTTLHTNFYRRDSK